MPYDPGAAVKDIMDMAAALAKANKAAGTGGTNNFDLSTDSYLSSLGLDPASLGALSNSSSQGTSSSWSSQPVLPPALELLAEMRARRESEAAQGKTLAEILATNLPANLQSYPGFERGGLADVLLGIITGQGPAMAQQVLPQNQRVINRVGIPVPEEGQPAVSQDAGAAMSFAQAILNALRNISTGGSASQQSSGSTSEPASAPPPNAPNITPPATGSSGDAAVWASQQR